MSGLAVVNCGQLVTLRGPARPRVRAELRELSIVEDGALLARDGRIVAAGASREIEPLIPPDARVIDAGGRIVLPGFVDAHTHPVFAGTRAAEFAERAAGTSYEQIAEAGGGILSTVRATRAASEEELYRSASRYAQWFLRNGTTTIEAKSGYGLSLESELKMLRVIRRMNSTGPLAAVATFLGAHEIPPEYRGRSGDYAELVMEEMLPRVADEKLAAFCDIFCEPGIFGLDTARRILTRAKQLGFGLRMHADQLRLSNGAQLAAELGAATADHLEYTGAAGIEALKCAGVQPVLLPGSVYALGSRRYPDARAMIEAGLAIVLATDFNPGSSPTPSMPMALSIACTQMGLLPSEGISAATVNAAYSLGLGAEAGSLEPGKRADFAIHDCSDYREIPCFFGVEHAWKVIHQGRIVFER